MRRPFSGTRSTLSVLAHIGGMIAIAATIVVYMALPFLPGRYDSAQTFSNMAQLVGAAGLLLAPIGVLSLVFARKGAASLVRGASLVTLAIVAILVSVAAIAYSAASLGVTMLVLFACAVGWFWRAMKRAEGGLLDRWAPTYLLVVPLAVATAEFTLLGAATDFARHRAIQNSAELIRDIEAYRRANGAYPTSLLALHQDYHPDVIGIERYFYEPHGDAFNLFFETPSSILRPGVREIVMFNPRDDHRLVGHDSDILLWTAEQLEERRAWYAVHEAGAPHWKYFLLD